LGFGAAAGEGVLIDEHSLPNDGNRDPIVRAVHAGPMVILTAENPVTLVLGGSLDRPFTPLLEAAIRALAATGTLRVDATAVDRLDLSMWNALSGGCSRAAIAGVDVEVTGLRWNQVLDVLAATPLSEIAAQVAAVHALRPEHPRTAAAAPPGPGAAAGVAATAPKP
jgi:ABC-type transporter Mla MlaB component